MRIFRNAWFERFARKEKIADATLVEAIRDVERGLIDADLGGGVIKQRIARPGKGKSGGYRTVILYLRKQRAFFVFGFAKNERSNMSSDEEIFFKAMARDVLALSDKSLADLIERGKFSEFGDDDQEI